MSYSSQEIKAITQQEAEIIYGAENTAGQRFIDRNIVQSWRIIPLSNSDIETKRRIHRLNSLGSLYYFAKVILRKDRLQTNSNLEKNLHYQMCNVVTKDGLKEVIEIPRDHFKSSIYSECFPIWRALPFTDEDEQLMRVIGYKEEYITWMKITHNQDIRILIVSEILTNAKKLGVKISAHYEGNDVFKWVFPEISPDKTTTWTNESLHQKRTPAGRIHGEGTFDFLGVGGALQSRHYDLIIQDDLVGADAINSPDTVMPKTIEYHQMLVGAMDTQNGRDTDEVVVGNRWGYKDLNSHIRANEQYFNFTTHSAIGGCCPIHPQGELIFPEAFSLELLKTWQSRLGTYLFSCQFLNMPVNPNDVKFKKNDLRYYEMIRDEAFTYTDNRTLGSDPSRPRLRHKVKIRHHVHEGDVIEDIAPKNLRRYMIVDPNHSGNDGRCRHAITVTGIAEDPRRIYLLDVWAKACGIDEFIDTMLYLAVEVWKLDCIYLETIAAQKYLKYHLEYKLSQGEYKDQRYKNLKIKELKTPKTANAKALRIESLAPIFQRGEFWIASSGMQEFLEEFESYPSGKLKDVLDTLGYGPQVWGFESGSEEVEEQIAWRRNQFARNMRHTNTGY